MAPTEISLEEAQGRLALSYHQAWRLCRDGKLAYRKDEHGKIRVDAASVDAYLAANALRAPSDENVIGEEVIRAARGGFVVALAIARLEQLADEYEAKRDTERAQLCRDHIYEIRHTTATVDRARRVLIVDSPSGGHQEAPINSPTTPPAAPMQLADMPAARRGLVS